MTLLRVGNPVGGGVLITGTNPLIPVSSRIKVNGLWHTLMDNLSGAGLIKVLPTEVDNYKIKFPGISSRFVAQ
jgi:hypothetical protein